jgi:hypothetical protein
VFAISLREISAANRDNQIPLAKLAGFGFKSGSRIGSPDHKKLLHDLCLFFCRRDFSCVALKNFLLALGMANSVRVSSISACLC